MLQDDLDELTRWCEASPDHVQRLLRLAAAAGLAVGLPTAPTEAALTYDGDPGEPAPPPAPASRTARYVDLGLIGRGGMGEVRRVRDLELGRVVALKRARRDLGGSPSALARFMDEIRTTAQLQHPGIVPVYDVGRTDDGEVWFTMREVQGRSLGAVLRERRGGAGPEAWTTRRLVSALHLAAQAVGYAHERGVVHRDLKPDNVMLGAFGEVQVMDWGLGKVTGRPEPAWEALAVSGDRDVTRAGRVLGTPAYMAPEQAAGRIDAVDARSDVYALGAILHEILAGRPPYAGATGREILRQVLDGPPEPPATAPDAQDLVPTCLRAMSREPAGRHPSATAFADELQAWLDGSKRRERALEVVAQARVAQQEAAALSERARSARAEADERLAAIAPWAPEEDKLAAWAAQDDADALEAVAAQRLLERDQLLAASLTHAPTLAEAHAALGEDQLARHAIAELDHDRAAARRAEALLRSHLDMLPPAHPLRARGAAYLKGTGAVSLVTSPAGADVELLRYEPHGRRLIARTAGHLGRTPLSEVPLEMGSYLLLLRRPGHATVRYPVHIARGAHWDGLRPGDAEPTPIELPAEGALGPDDVYVPAGWFIAGGASEFNAAPLGTRLWCDPFVLRRFPVTNREYLAFLDDLVASGREEDALRCVPRERSGVAGVPGAPIYGRGADGRFFLRPDADGDVWLPHWPVVMVDVPSAESYATWLAARTGSPWRLPWEFEWEKAARGVDGRRAPWGDGVDGSYANTRDSHAGRPGPDVVDSFPIDESPYGVRGLGGNVRDRCVDDFRKDPVLPADRVVAPFLEPSAPSGRTLRTDRGGMWNAGVGFSRAAVRDSNLPHVLHPTFGFRIARSWRSRPG